MLRVTLKGLLQHKIRFALTTFAVVTGVAFVVGAFVLTDSVRAQFNQLFVDINKGIDLTVRGQEQFEQSAFGVRPPVPADLLAQVREVPGVAEATGSASGLPAVLIGADGKAVQPTGGPPLGVTWTGESRLSQVTVVDGGPPQADDQVALDVDLASRGNVAAGDDVQVQTPVGPKHYTVSGTFSFGSGNALAGATLIAFTVPEAQSIFNLEGKYTEIAVALDAGADAEAVREQIASLLPAGTEVVPTSQVVSESQSRVGDIVDIFGNVLLGFAGVTLFVAAFLIANTFTIVVGQRVRELALLRAVGASSRQVAGSVLGEAFVVGVLASVIGFGLGVLVALLLNAVLSASGFGTSGTALVLGWRSVAAALVVGVGVTLLSAISPSWKATTVPPVAAMREGFSLGGMSMRARAALGAVLLAVGVAGIGWALYGKPDTVLLLTGMIGGALFVFGGVAALSPAVASGLAHVVGWPFARIFRTPGRLAEENAARNPRRTSSTASALMIGLALIATAFVVGNSLKESFRSTIGGSITADWYVSTGSFFGFSPEIATKMKELPELSAVTAGRGGQVQVDGVTKQVVATDLGTLGEMFKLDVQSGTIDASSRGVLVHKDPARDLGLQPGDTVTVRFPEKSGEVHMPVVAVYGDSSVLGNWAMDLQTFQENSVTNSDSFVAAKSAPGVSAEDARSAITSVTDAHPEVKVQDRAEFTKAQTDQLNALLAVINVFLFFAIVIAFIGIMNTLALSVFERTRELGLLRAVGMARRQVKRMVRLEAVIVAVFGALLGILVGLLFGIAVTVALPNSVVKSVAVPVGSLVTMVILAGLIGVLAAIWPARRAAKLDVLQAITTE